MGRNASSDMNNKMTFKICLGLILLALAVSGCGNSNNSATQKTETAAVAANTDSLVITIMGQRGKSILEVTESAHNVDYIASSVGAFVKGIDSVESGNGYAWLISVNDTMIKVAADKFITSDNDTVRWHLRKID